MSLMQAYTEIDPYSALVMKISHMEELIALTEKYTRDHPTYRDWYYFSVQHLQKIKANYQLMLEKIIQEANGERVH